jgi:cyclopropane fatty-acyl-phospholipid synthase-like methyltransferase
VPGEWFEWQWDQTLFAGSAHYYEQGRLPNAPGLTEAFEKALGLNGRGRLLDVGCGPGTVTLRLASLFEEVVGLDADAGMIEEARRLASERAVTNARWPITERNNCQLGSAHFVSLPSRRRFTGWTGRS